MRKRFEHGVVTDSQTLEDRGTRLLLEHGCHWDGRLAGSVSLSQRMFERHIMPFSGFSRLAPEKESH
jgi:hypothetical protein